MKIIVGVLTKSEMTQRRRACEDTWFCRLRQANNVTALFLTGMNEMDGSYVEGDTLLLASRDDYMALAYKTKAFCQWAMTQEFDYLFKCDDDTFIATDRFLEYQPEGDYIGVDPCDHINPKFASGGAGYWLSRRAAQIVADMDVKAICSREKCKPCSEDLVVYHALMEKGIKFVQDKRFQAWNQPHRHPHAANEIITCHYIKPEEMCRMDQKMQDIQTGCKYGYMDRGNHRRFNKIYRDQMQVEWMGGWGKNDGPILLQESISVIGDWPHKEALKRGKLTLTYLRDLDGHANFSFMPPPYDFEYVPLMRSKNPLNRNPNALYVFGLKKYGYPSGKLFDRAEYTDTYSYRYELAKMPGVVSMTSTGPLAADKIAAQHGYKFSIACENMIARGWMTEKLVDCFMSDTVPIYIGGKLPMFLENCVCRVTDLEHSKAAAQIHDYLHMSDDSYLAKIANIRELRFSSEFYEMFSYQTLFDKAGLLIDTSLMRSDGTPF